MALLDFLDLVHPSPKLCQELNLIWRPQHQVLKCQAFARKYIRYNLLRQDLLERQWNRVDETRLHAARVQRQRDIGAFVKIAWMNLNVCHADISVIVVQQS